LCTALAAIDSNPDEFMKAVNKGMLSLKHEEDYAHEIPRLASKALVDVHGHENVHSHIDKENGRYLMVVEHHIATMMMAKTMIKVMTSDTSHLKKMIASFQKQVRRKFPETRAYYRKHSGERTAAFKTTQKRLHELKNAQDQFISGLSLVMGKKRKAA